MTIPTVTGAAPTRAAGPAPAHRSGGDDVFAGVLSGIATPGQSGTSETGRPGSGGPRPSSATDRGGAAEAAGAGSEGTGAASAGTGAAEGVLALPVALTAPDPTAPSTAAGTAIAGGLVGSAAAADGQAGSPPAAGGKAPLDGAQPPEAVAAAAGATGPRSGSAVAASAPDTTPAVAADGLPGAGAAGHPGAGSIGSDGDAPATGTPSTGLPAAGGDGVRTPPGADPATVPPAASSAAPGPTAPTSPTGPGQVAAPPPAPAQGQAALAGQLSTPLLALRSAPAGEHTLTVRVSPEEFGPVTVRAHIGAEGVRIELLAPDAGRDALRAALPDLRRDLAGAGLTANLDLGSGRGQDQRAGHTGAGEASGGQTSNGDPHGTHARGSTARSAVGNEHRPGAQTGQPHHGEQAGPGSASPRPRTIGGQGAVDVLL